MLSDKKMKLIKYLHNFRARMPEAITLTLTAKKSISRPQTWNFYRSYVEQAFRREQTKESPQKMWNWATQPTCVHYCRIFYVGCYNFFVRFGFRNKRDARERNQIRKTSNRSQRSKIWSCLGLKGEATTNTISSVWRTQCASKIAQREALQSRSKRGEQRKSHKNIKQINYFIICSFRARQRLPSRCWLQLWTLNLEFQSRNAWVIISCDSLRVSSMWHARR